MTAEIVMKLVWSEFVWSDKIWICIGAVFMVLGVVGCFVKKIPGTPLCWAGLLLLQLMEEPPFYTFEMLILSAVTIVVISIDYVAPVISEKMLGNEKTGKYISNILKFVVSIYMVYRFVIVLFQ